MFLNHIMLTVLERNVIMCSADIKECKYYRIWSQEQDMLSALPQYHKIHARTLPFTFIFVITHIFSDDYRVACFMFIGERGG